MDEATAQRDERRDRAGGWRSQTDRGAADPCERRLLDIEEAAAALGMADVAARAARLRGLLARLRAEAARTAAPATVPGASATIAGATARN